MLTDAIIKAILASESGNDGFHCSRSFFENITIYGVEPLHENKECYLSRLLSDCGLFYITVINYESFNCDVFSGLDEATVFFNKCVANK